MLPASLSQKRKAGTSCKEGFGGFTKLVTWLRRARGAHEPALKEDEINVKVAIASPSSTGGETSCPSRNRSLSDGATLSVHKTSLLKSGEMARRDSTCGTKRPFAFKIAVGPQSSDSDFDVLKPTTGCTSLQDLRPHHTGDAKFKERMEFLAKAIPGSSTI